MSAKIKPLSFASFVAQHKETIQPETFASFIAPKQERITPLIFATYNPDDAEIKAVDVTLSPASVTVSKNKAAQVDLVPLSITIDKRNAPQIDLLPFRLAVTFYTPPSDSFISRYKPQVAVSFYPPDNRYYFPIWPKEELLFFPPELIKFAWKSTKQLAWQTQTERSGGGKIRTSTNLVRPNVIFETKLAHMTDEHVQILFNFIRKTEGTKRPFLFLDDDANLVNDTLLLRDAFGHYRLPVYPLATNYIEYIWYADNIKITIDGDDLPENRFMLYNGAIYILDENGREIKTDLPPIKATFRYYWRVHFVDDGQGIERIFYRFNRSKTLKMEVVR